MGYRDDGHSRDGWLWRTESSTMSNARVIVLLRPIVIAKEIAQVGFEPTASLVLSQGGLPIAYRAVYDGPMICPSFIW